MVRAERKASEASEFPIVGIGASAGGITALHTLFQAIPARPNLAFVVVQHLSPDQPSQLAALLGKWTPLCVREAADGVKLERDCVFVAPPGRALALKGGVFATEPFDGSGPRAGIDNIDSFFESFAKDFGRRAIAVVLSGAGADGAAGVVRVKQAGGMVLVQDPNTAMYGDMPAAAIANGAADHIMPLGSLAQELVACASPEYVRSPSAATWADEVTKALDGIMALIQGKAGLDLTGYKTTPLLWRIQRRMELRRAPLFRDYEALLHDDPAELETLIRGIPIHVTGFFRDAQAWGQLQSDVIPLLLDEARDGPIRAWTPACATGEEAYSLAMLLAEHARAMKMRVEFQVFATDAAAEIVARAGRGVFEPEAVDALSLERRQRFFYAADGAFHVKRALREKMVFAPQDLLADPPFSGLDLVTCRNLLIYLEPDAAKRVVYLLHSSLAMGGYLFLGKGETLPAKQRGFEVVSATAHIYRKVACTTEVNMSFPKRPAGLRKKSSLGPVEAHIHRAVLEQQELPSVLVDDHFHILRLYGETRPFLRFKPGQPTLNLLEFVSPWLSSDIQAAAKQARSEQRAVTVANLAGPEGDELSLRLRVTPLQSGDGQAIPLLISFILTPAISGDARAETGELPDLPVRSGRAADSSDWSEALRLSHEELEASREELQALNEELRASNDQLNIANDDLNRANAQLQEKIAALEMQSRVLSSGAVMTLFLDEEMRVRWFTPAVRELFPLMPADAGRRITDLVPKFDDKNFVGDVRAVMQKNEPREAEVHNVEGKWFLLRIGPYLDLTDTPAGVAVTFTDITVRKRAEEELQARNEELERFNKVAVGRELRMIELKKEVNALRSQRGEVARYALEFEANEI